MHNKKTSQINEFHALEIPLLPTCLSKKGSGFIRYFYQGSSYLIRHTEHQEPEVVGRIVGSFKKKDDMYAASYVPYASLEANERTALDSLLTHL